MGRSLARDINSHPSQQRYHPYVNSPSPCQRIFEIACFVLILASVPAWLGGVYSIFVTGYGTALGLIGLLTFGTRRHSIVFIVFAILFFIFVIVVIILNAIDPIGKNLPFNDEYGYPTDTPGLSKRDLFARQTTSSSEQPYCSVLANCNLTIANLGQLDDGQLRLNYGQGASDVTFHLRNGILFDDMNRTCYISGADQLQCDYAYQTENFREYCVVNGSLTYAGSNIWWECNAGTGGSNVYTTKYYPQCTEIRLQVLKNRCTNSTDGSSYDGNAVTGGDFLINTPINGTNSTDNGGGGAIAGGAILGGAFVGSRIYAYIDSGIILLVTLIAIVAGFFVAGEFRPAPGTLTSSSTTSTTAAPAGYAPVYTGAAPATGAANYAVAPAVIAAGAAAPFVAGAAAAPALVSTAPAARSLSPNTVLAAADSAPVVYSSAPAGPAPASVIAAAAGVTAPLLAIPAAMAVAPALAPAPAPVYPAAAAPNYTSTAPVGRGLSPNTVLAAADSAPVVYSSAPAGPAPASVLGAAAGVTAPLLAAPALMAATATPIVADTMSYGSYKTANTGPMYTPNEQFYTPETFQSPAVVAGPVVSTTTTTTAVAGVPVLADNVAYGAKTPLLSEAARDGF